MTELEGLTEEDLNLVQMTFGNKKEVTLKSVPSLQIFFMS